MPVARPCTCMTPHAACAARSSPASTPTGPAPPTVHRGRSAGLAGKASSVRPSSSSATVRAVRAGADTVLVPASSVRLTCADRLPRLVASRTSPHIETIFRRREQREGGRRHGTDTASSPRTRFRMTVRGDADGDGHGGGTRAWEQHPTGGGPGTVRSGGTGGREPIRPGGDYSPRDAADIGGAARGPAAVPARGAVVGRTGRSRSPPVPAEWVRLRDQRARRQSAMRLVCLAHPASRASRQGPGHPHGGSQDRSLGCFRRPVGPRRPANASADAL